MSSVPPSTTPREGSLDAPTRHPLDWKSPQFYDQAALDAELERVFHICHGCRRCVSLCQAFPTLFDLVDESKTMEIDGVAKSDYAKVVEQCYLCDLCYQTKCPYVPPHEWNVDFPHLMLRAKAAAHKRGETPFSAKVLSSTTAVGKLSTIPVVVEAVNALNRSPTGRKLLEKTLGVHRDARVPAYANPTARKRLKNLDGVGQTQVAGRTRGRVALFATCYCNYSTPEPVEDLAAILRHNGVAVTLIAREVCCGMPKLELGDLESVAKYKEQNIPVLAAAIRDGYDITAAIPSCVLMFKQELPLMFPGRRRRATGQAPYLRPVRIPVAAPPVRHAEDRLQAGARQDRVSRAVPSARAEHRPEDARRARPGAGHRDPGDRALFRPRRHVRGEGQDLRAVAQDRQAGRDARAADRRRALRQ
jgi:Fe-S oxidoreductase